MRQRFRLDCHLDADRSRRLGQQYNRVARGSALFNRQSLRSDPGAMHWFIVIIRVRHSHVIGHTIVSASAGGVPESYYGVILCVVVVLGRNPDRLLRVPIAGCEF